MYSSPQQHYASSQMMQAHMPQQHSMMGSSGIYGMSANGSPLPSSSSSPSFPTSQHQQQAQQQQYYAQQQPQQQMYQQQQQSMQGQGPAQSLLQQALPSQSPHQQLMMQQQPQQGAPPSPLSSLSIPNNNMSPNQSMGGNSGSNVAMPFVDKTPVLYFSNLPFDVTESDLAQAIALFGFAVRVVLVSKRNEAFLQMQTVEQAANIVQHYSPYGGCNIRGKLVPVQFSHRQELLANSPRTRASPNSAATGMGGFSPSSHGNVVSPSQHFHQPVNAEEQPSPILLCSFTNVRNVVNIDHLEAAFSPFGRLSKLVFFEKRRTGAQGFIEFQDINDAIRAQAELDGKDIYAGGSSMRVGFSRLPTLTVKPNDPNSRDYLAMSTTGSSTPTHTGGMMSGYPYQPQQQQQQQQQMMMMYPQQASPSPSSTASSRAGPQPQQGGRNAPPHPQRTSQQSSMSSVPMPVPAHVNLDSSPAYLQLYMPSPIMLEPPSTNPTAATASGANGNTATPQQPQQYAILSNGMAVPITPQMMMASPHHPHQAMLHPQHQQPQLMMTPNGGLIAVNAPLNMNMMSMNGTTGAVNAAAMGNVIALPQEGCVLLASNLPDELCDQPDKLFVLFGLYGDVYRVKLLHRKKNTALIQFATPEQAAVAMHFLNRAEIQGSTIMLNVSKFAEINLPPPSATAAATGAATGHRLGPSPTSTDSNDSDFGSSLSDDGKHSVDGDTLSLSTNTSMTSSTSTSTAAATAAVETTKDFTDSKAHRFRQSNSRNATHICSPTPVLHIANLPIEVSEAELLALMSSGVDAPSSASAPAAVTYDPLTSRVKGVKFLRESANSSSSSSSSSSSPSSDTRMVVVSFGTKDDAIRALLKFHNTKYRGKWLRISFSNRMFSNNSSSSSSSSSNHVSVTTTSASSASSSSSSSSSPQPSTLNDNSSPSSSSDPSSDDSSPSESASPSQSSSPVNEVADHPSVAAPEAQAQQHADQVHRVSEMLQRSSMQ